MPSESLAFLKALGLFDNSSGIATFSSAVIVGISRNAWNTIPILSRRNSASASSFIVDKFSFAILIMPEVVASIPPITIIKVDLPAPDGPVIPTVLPASISKDIPCKIFTLPALLASSSFTSCICISGGTFCSCKQGDVLFVIRDLYSNVSFKFRFNTLCKGVFFI